ncbi:hypothetical protein BDZ45DRAFT_801317 [Acephala macrosclerotiorum]|nr:hypothetical protein BDZ45DRAFT_801317 [Acephala macrosclerotiorum]
MAPKLREADKGLTKKVIKEVSKKVTVKEEDDYETPIKVESARGPKNAFLPYLALGLAPVTTSGRGLYCGINALHISYNAARKALAGPGNEPEPLPNKYFHDLFKSQAYGDAITTFLATQKAQGFWDGIRDSDAEIARERRRLMSPNNLFEQQVATLLDMANHEQGTTFLLGIIEQGFRGIWRSKKECDLEAVYNTLLYVAPLREFLSRPVVWIWLNNAEKQGKPGSRKAEAHWEGLAITNGKPSGERTRRVRAWGLGTEVENDVKNGVWIVEGDIGGEGIEHMLEARSGSFVREVSPPPGLQVPEGMRYMEHSNGENVGLVFEFDIRCVEDIHANAPTADTDPAWVVNEGPSNVEPKPKPNPMKQTIPGSTKPILATEMYRGVPTPFVIFRTVEITDKIGTIPKTIDDEVKYIDSYTYGNGDFVLQTGETYPRNGTTIVTKIEGGEGYVRNRVLQTVFSPWGLQDTLPVAADIGLTVASSAEAIRSEAQKWGMEEVSKNKARAIKDIKEFQDARTCYLPMYRVLEEIETITIKTFADGEEKIIFQEGEIVLGGLGAHKGQREVTDFEGYVAMLPDEQLELINRPWNLRLSNEGMGRAGWMSVPTEGPAVIVVAEATGVEKVEKRGKKRSALSDDGTDDDDVKPTKKIKTSKTQSPKDPSSEDDTPTALPTPKKTPRKTKTKTIQKTIKKNTQKNAMNNGKKILSQVTSSEDELSAAIPTPPKKTRKSKK